MKKKLVILLLVMIMAIAAVGWFFALYGGDNKNEQSMNIFFNPEMRKFVQIMQILHESYYRETSEAELIDEAINGMLKTLDPHSVYIYKNQDVKNFTMQTTGEFGGIGFRVGSKDGKIMVISPIENTPASRAGIRAGDIILKIDTVNTSDMNLDDAVSLMRGDPGTPVSLKIDRFGTMIDFNFKREMIKIKSIPYYGMVDDSTGYIKLTQFTDNIDVEFKAALDNLFKKQHAKKLVLDLRQNPGGLLPQAITISNFFIPKGLLIVSTGSKNSNMDMQFNATKPMYEGYFPLVVLVDDGSASASEIVAGAVQDWDRGIIMGDTTYGKGSVQSVIDFSRVNKNDSGIFKYTSARYFTPSGRSIDKELISYEKNQKDTSSYYSLSELHRNLPGGGGIIPDYVRQERYLVPAEIDIIRKQATFTYAADYLSKHKLKDAEILNLKKDIIDGYFKYLSDQSINIDTIIADSSLYSDNVKTLQFELARQTGGESLYYKLFVSTDALIAKAAGLMKECRSFDEMLKKLEPGKEE